MKYILVLIIVFTALGYAGQSDYEDSVLAEMKNNGSYYELTEEHPDYTDAQLIKCYDDMRSKDESAR